MGVFTISVQNFKPEFMVIFLSNLVIKMSRKRRGKISSKIYPNRRFGTSRSQIFIIPLDDFLAVERTPVVRVNFFHWRPGVNKKCIFFALFNFKKIVLY